ncbi:hypothetical protein Hanom_Chr02g00160651 [Helianthus anomalus]
MVRGKPTNLLTVLIINLSTFMILPLKDLILLYLDAFQYEYGLNSCFHKNKANFGIKISMGVFVLILCSYVTLSMH